MTDKLDRVEKIAREEMNKFGLNKWIFKLGKKRKITGLCNDLTKTIELSKSFVLHESYENIKDTILHEIAHAIVGCHNQHNLVWQEACVIIGANPKAYCSFNNHANYRSVCSKCKTSYSFFRKPKSWKCKKCLNPITSWTDKKGDICSGI